MVKIFHVQPGSGFHQKKEKRKLRVAACPSAIGTLVVATRDRSIVAIFAGDDEASLLAALGLEFPGAVFSAGGDRERGFAAQIAAFVADPRGRLNLPLDPGGTQFQREVWGALRKIPAGSTSTYSEVARQIGRASATRAVAQACAANRIAIAIPCHRVIRADGGLSGFRWGVARKQALLAREALAA